MLNITMSRQCLKTNASDRSPRALIRQWRQDPNMVLTESEIITVLAFRVSERDRIRKHRSRSRAKQMKTGLDNASRLISSVEVDQTSPPTPENTPLLCDECKAESCGSLTPMDTPLQLNVSDVQDWSEYFLFNSNDQSHDGALIPSPVASSQVWSMSSIASTTASEASNQQIQLLPLFTEDFSSTSLGQFAFPQTSGLPDDDNWFETPFLPRQKFADDMFQTETSISDDAHGDSNLV
ncbi:hypothetical protein V1512DRAFT_258837 [Lipomyces arxii]|uniref:uncharacterized protein n=1 Tax=Lipomyces arxii TaxID=56418 RepID=UPI0034CD332C